MSTLEKIKLEITSHFLWDGEVKTDIPYAVQVCLDIIDKYAKQEPMREFAENLCDSCTNRACKFQSGILRSKCDFYIAPMPHLEPDNCGNYVVQQKPKTGHWIETEYHRWKCSVCREKGMSEWDNIHNVRTNFCPDCGTRMVEPQESEDV